jgi:hypothetical protein
MTVPMNELMENHETLITGLSVLGVFILGGVIGAVMNIARSGLPSHDKIFWLLLVLLLPLFGMLIFWLLGNRIQSERRVQ